MELTDVARQFVLHWGEMGTAWGVNRTVAQIRRPLVLPRSPASCGRDRGNLGGGALQRQQQPQGVAGLEPGATSHVLGDRRDYFETSHDVWALFTTIVRERKEREFDPTTRLLQQLVEQPGFRTRKP